MMAARSPDITWRCTSAGPHFHSSDQCRQQYEPFSSSCTPPCALRPGSLLSKLHDTNRERNNSPTLLPQSWGQKFSSNFFTRTTCTPTSFENFIHAISQQLQNWITSETQAASEVPSKFMFDEIICIHANLEKGSGVPTSSMKLESQ